MSKKRRPRPSAKLAAKAARPAPPADADEQVLGFIAEIDQLGDALADFGRRLKAFLIARGREVSPARGAALRRASEGYIAKIREFMGPDREPPRASSP